MDHLELADREAQSFAVTHRRQLSRSLACETLLFFAVSIGGYVIAFAVV